MQAVWAGESLDLLVIYRLVQDSVTEPSLVDDVVFPCNTIGWLSSRDSVRLCTEPPHWLIMSFLSAQCLYQYFHCEHCVAQSRKAPHVLIQYDCNTTVSKIVCLFRREFIRKPLISIVVDNYVYPLPRLSN